MGSNSTGGMGHPFPGAGTPCSGGGTTPFRRREHPVAGRQHTFPGARQPCSGGGDTLFRGQERPVPIGVSGGLALFVRSRPCVLLLLLFVVFYPWNLTMATLGCRKLPPLFFWKRDISMSRFSVLLPLFLAKKTLIHSEQN